MSLNPLNKLRRFSSAPAQADAPSTVAPSPQTTVRKAEIVPPKAPQPEAPRLTPEQLKALAKPEASLCKHCKCAYSDRNFIMYCKGPALTGWYCFECWTYHYQHKELPGPKTIRVIPKRATA